MRHIFTGLVAAIEAVMIAVAGIAAIALPVLLVGVITFSLSIDFVTLAQLTAGLWTLAHGMQFHIAIDEATALTLGIGAEPLDFTVTLAPLLLSLLTAFLSWRMGRRFATDVPTGVSALTGGSLGFYAASFLLTWFAGTFVTDAPWLRALVASLWFLIPAWVGFWSTHADALSTAWFKLKIFAEQSGAPKLGWGFESYLPRTIRLAVALVAGVLFVGSAALTLSLGFAFVDIMSLSQSLHLDVIGSFVFFLGQLAYLPTLLVWAIAWLSGAGFMVGEGSSVTPFETLLGPLPAIPVFAAIPEGSPSWGFLAVLAVVLTGVAVGALFGGLPEYRTPAWWQTGIMALFTVLAVGLAVAGIGALASGAIGPGRLLITGIDVWLTAGLVALELFIGLLAGLALRRVGSASSHRETSVPEFEYVELVSAPAHPAPAQQQSEEPAPVAAARAVGATSTPEPTIESEVGEPSDDQETAVIAAETPVPRIAHPDDDTSKPWFRRAATPRRKSTPRKPTQTPSFSEEALIEEYAWPPADEDPSTGRGDR